METTRAKRSGGGCDRSFVSLARTKRGLPPCSCSREYSNRSFAHILITFGKAFQVGMITIQMR
jgi:hypothetical protein